MNLENRIYKKLESFSFFKIKVIANLEFENKIYKNVSQYNNDSFITLENWEHYKEVFFEQRMNTYYPSYKLAEKIKLELEELEALTTNENKYKILKDRYKEFLKNITKDAEVYLKDYITSLSLKGYALRLFYENKIITKDNAKKYLEGTKWTSGDKLYNEFIKWSNRTDRKADPEGKIKLKNKIELFENVIKELPEDKTALAIDELQILNSYKSKYQ